MMIFSILKSFSGPQMDIFRGRNGKSTENIQLNSTYQIKLDSSKTNDIWLSYGPKTALKSQLFHIWAYVFWPLLSHFWANWAEMFYVNSENHYLSIAIEK